MFKKFQFFVMGFLILLACPLWADWVSLTRDAVPGSEPQIQIVVEDEHHCVVEVSLLGFYRDADSSTNLWQVRVPGNATTEELGRSALPVVTGMLALPSDVTRVRITNYETIANQEFSGFQVYPFQTPTTDEEKDEPAFTKDESHYLSHDLYPTAPLTVEDIAIWRNQKVVTFRFVPIQVRPARSILLVHSRIRFTLEYVRERSESLPQVAALECFEAMYQKLLLNYRPSSVTRAPEKYLVIAQDDLASAIEPLVDWRKGQNLQTELVKLSAVGNTPEKIKDYVSQKYSQGLAYLLLVGDPNTLPLYKWDGAYPSDYWYSCLAGNDLYADICVGRICATSAAEVETSVQKIKAYESNQSRGSDWASKVLLVAHKEGAPGEYEGCLEVLRKVNYTYKVAFTTRYGSQASSTNAVVQNDIAAGYAIVTYRGHGSETNWSGWNGTNFTTSNMRSLSNTVYPVFFSIACLNSAIDKSAETLSEACAKTPQGGGSAFLGASRPSYTIQNHDFCKFLFVGAFTQGLDRIGIVSNYANAELLKKYNNSSYAGANVKMYLWLGDPAMKLHINK